MGPGTFRKRSDPVYTLPRTVCSPSLAQSPLSWREPQLLCQARTTHSSGTQVCRKVMEQDDHRQVFRLVVPSDFHTWFNNPVSFFACWVKNILSKINYINLPFPPKFLSIYNLKVEQSLMRPHIFWGLIWIQIVCNSQHWSSHFAASKLI